MAMHTQHGFDRLTAKPKHIREKKQLGSAINKKETKQTSNFLSEIKS